MTSTMKRVLKILHFLVLAYSGLVSTLLLLKVDASQRTTTHQLHVFNHFTSYFFTQKSLLLLLVLILALRRLFARSLDSPPFEYSLPSILSSAIAIFNVNARRDPALPHPTAASHEFGSDHTQREPTSTFNNYLVDSDTINELALLFGPTAEDENHGQQIQDVIHSNMISYIMSTSTHDDGKDQIKRIYQEQHHDDQTFDSPQIDHDQFLTMVEHQEEKVIINSNIIINDIVEEKRSWADEIFDQYHHQQHVDNLGLTSIYYDNDIVGIQSNDMTSTNSSTAITEEEEEEVDHVIPLPVEEVKSLDETWKEIERLLSPQSKQQIISPDHEAILMPPTPRRTKVAKLKSSSIIESRDMSEWKDKKKTLSFNEEVYLRQRGGMVRSDTLEDIESLNKKFDAFIAQNKQQMFIQRQESEQRLLIKKTSHGG